MKLKVHSRSFCACLILTTLVVSLGGCRTQQAVTEAPVEVVPVAALVDQSDRLYVQREDLARVRDGLNLLRRARTADANNYDVSWRIARLDYYLGAHSKERAEREKAFEEGIEAGKTAIRLQDNKPEGHFWLGANYGGSAQASVLGGLAAIDDIREQMEAVLRTDETYQSGSAYMVLGQVELEAGRMLGDPEKAVEYLEKGLKLGPNNPLLRLRLAQAYLRVNRQQDARKQLDAIMALTPDPNYLPEHKEAVTEARKIIDRGL
ncbi:MAG TPA: TRAP transporter TatT component family protein [Pyrinomonadaceae bacterium]|jgi:tetratricopeptide (TPR) repeat protein|nr:TRAP transporter TatT component family protein [Pyrinomonadaceae bacterium]